MDDAGAAAFGPWPHVESVRDVAATAIVTDHDWPQNLDSVDACELITLESMQTDPLNTISPVAKLCCNPTLKIGVVLSL
jgi:hypothetical protein